MNQATTEPVAQISLNAFDIILHSSGMVLIVLALLLASSVLTWAIILSKYRVFRKCSVSTEAFLDVFWGGKSMDQIYADAKKSLASPMARIFQAGYIELQRLMESERQKAGARSAGIDVNRLLPPESTIHNIERAIARATRSESVKLERSLTFLATTGSTAPFIGLFGTVWGIMNAFQNIGAQGSASLAIVAPGIAEALIATAVGLFAAIPAVMGYNYFANQLRSLRAQMENFAGDFLNIVRRNFLGR